MRLVMLLGIAGLALILWSGFLRDKAEKQTDAASVQSAETASQEQAEQYCRRMEQQLVDVLEQVEGVGSCRVMLTATGSPETIYAQDAEQEQGENRTRIQRKCVIVSDSGSQQPLVQQIAAPEISGVIVVCSGASSAVVQERVTKAVQAVRILPQAESASFRRREPERNQSMKKPSFIIGKKQIILSCLTLMLAIAVYVNYAMSDGKLETAQVQSKDNVTYGDTAFVNAEANQAAEESQPAEESKPADETSGAYSVNGDAEETAADVEAEYTAAGSAENYFAQARTGTHQQPG